VLQTPFLNFKKIVKKHFKKTYLCIPTEQLEFSSSRAKNLLASSPLQVQHFRILIFVLSYHA